MSLVSSGRPPFVLVTGSTGFLGFRLVEMLVKNGYRVRALTRKTSNEDRLKRLNVQICHGDINDLASLEPAFEGVDFVVHAAAETKGDTVEILRTATDGTLNMVRLSKKMRVKKLVYISSCSVYGVSEFRRGQIIGEDGTLERHPEKRGIYSEAKLKAERILVDCATREGVPFVCLRPGTIFGPGGEIYTPMMGFSLGKRVFVIIDNGNFVLPLIYIDNLVEAVMLVLGSGKGAGEVYNVVDADHISKREYVDSLLRKLYPQGIFVYLPYRFLYALVYLQEAILTMVRRKPLLTTYRLISSQQNIIYDSSKIRRELGWNPSTSMKDAMDKVLAREIARRRGA